MFSTISVFDNLEQDSTNQRIASRRALALAHNRVEARLGTFLRGAISHADFAQRIALTENDFISCVESAANEVGYAHPEHIALTLRDEYHRQAAEKEEPLGVEFADNGSDDDDEDTKKESAASPLAPGQETDPLQALMPGANPSVENLPAVPQAGGSSPIRPSTPVNQVPGVVHPTGVHAKLAWVALTEKQATRFLADSGLGLGPAQAPQQSQGERKSARELWEVAVNSPNGFTTSIFRSVPDPTDGFTVGVTPAEPTDNVDPTTPAPKTKQTIIPFAEFSQENIGVPHVENFLQKYDSLLTQPGYFFGGWQAPNEGEDSMWLDVSQNVPEKEPALQLGREFEQEAIYDVANDIVIPCNGSDQDEQQDQSQQPTQPQADPQLQTPVAPPVQASAQDTFDQDDDPSRLVSCPCCGGDGKCNGGGKCSKCSGKGKVPNFGDSLLDSLGTQSSWRVIADGKDTGNTDLGGPEPKIDKKLWTRDNPGDPKKELGQEKGLKTKDITEPIKAKNDDKLEEIGEDKTEHVKLPNNKGDAGFDDGKVNKGPHTKTFPKGDQADPVTRESISSFFPSSAIVEAAFAALR